MKPSSLSRFAWGVLIYNLAVILWGAFVRASGSGAGCGSHWPLCNGEVLPHAQSWHTIIEFSHRLSSGLSFLLVSALTYFAFKSFPRGHRVRLAAGFSMGFILSEALIGAALVLLGLVAKDQSVTRAFSICLHLINTFLLIASLALTASWAKQPEKTSRPPFAALDALPLILALVLGITGAITALGDTLFPSKSLREGMSKDFARGSSFLVQLRVLHPLLSVLFGFYLIILAQAIVKKAPGTEAAKLGKLLSGLIVWQFLLGFANILLLAPIAIQVMHLLSANLVWLTLVLFIESKSELTGDLTLTLSDLKYNPQAPL